MKTCAKTELAKVPDRFNKRLFIGIYPGGLVYADRYVEINGDYKRLGFLPYDTLELQLEKDCPPALATEIRHDAAVMRTLKGQPFRTSTTGQTITLGTRL